MDQNLILGILFDVLILLFVGYEGRIKPGRHEDPIDTPTGSTILKIRH